MIDLHCHLLPGIDDGAVELAESIEMCRQAAASGCEAVIATPHQRHPSWWNTEPIRLQALLNQVQSKIGERPQLYLGGEVRVDAGLLESLERLSETGVLPLAGSSYLLLEFERRHPAVEPLTAVSAAQAAGWRPIVAHPEFIPGFCADLELGRSLVEAGALLQITAMSVTGDFGDNTRRCVAALLDEGLAHFVASDAHGIESRPPGLRRAQMAIASRWGKATARRLTLDNPRAVIDNRAIEPLTMVESETH